MEHKGFECKKVKYATEEYALFDIERIGKKSNRSKVPTRAYFCRCGSWHLTSLIDRKQILKYLARNPIHNEVWIG